MENDEFSLAKAKGSVSGTWINEKTGEKTGLDERHNQMMYAAADAIAAAYGGNQSKIPMYIGFIYGPDSSPSALADPSDRSINWQSIASELAACSANMQISAFSCPSNTVIDDPDETGSYTGNSVVFHAHSRSGAAGTYAFDTSGEGPYATVLANGMYIYHAVLLGKSGSQYVPLARVSLGSNGVYRQKPSDFELALDWKVSFF